MESYYYTESADTYRSTPTTAGPWDARFQHAGAPAALLAAAIDRAHADDRAIGRITIDMVRPVPVDRVRVRIEQVRPGTRADLVSAALTTVDGVLLMSARAWRFPPTEVRLPADCSPPVPAAGPVPAADAPGAVPEFFTIAHDHGFQNAIEWRFTRGSWTGRGPALAWIRMLNPLLDDAPPTGLHRLLLAADTVSGIAAGLDPADYLFPNVDLTVHAHREPVGEWIGFDATARYFPGGTGRAEAVVHDELGPVGTSTQTLLVGRRPAAAGSAPGPAADTAPSARTQEGISR